MHMINKVAIAYNNGKKFEAPIYADGQLQVKFTS